jgi:hypothetical protein
MVTNAKYITKKQMKKNRPKGTDMFIYTKKRKESEQQVIMKIQKLKCDRGKAKYLLQAKLYK